MDTRAEHATSMATLVDAVNRYTARQSGESPFYTIADGLIILRAQCHRHPTQLIHKPALCIVVQGAKWTAFGAHKLVYRAGEALVVNLEMPGASQVIEGSADRPYLSIVIELDQAAMREVLAQLDSPPAADTDAPESAFVMPLERELIDCASRAIRLLETPDAVPVLYPLLMREICYWLLSGPHGGRIANAIVGGERHVGVVKAMHVLRERFAQPFRIEELAAFAKLSPSAFHHKFKALTCVTPLQYQKQIRLLEARRLMAAGEANVQSAAARVGYESASQFNREYTRMFGAPPKRDISTFGRVGRRAS
ncbi:AraC family transcriptional regulator [Pandoraea captiosa]|jgi:AraC-like DNA-binding protein|uniref:AraC family transcriptional regulator n=1 Tax=Pandoraea captiosa TaxID=2508302 RepID=A0A5E4ZM27_9BURK|nr:AraC family transcriptional regulator [Pandoraea captiosa]VVE61310.1 AraC family transcriptional regulator [Pandoraea captiosa]